MGLNRSLAVVAGDGEGLAADEDDNFVVDDGPPGEAPPTCMPRRRLLPWQRLLLRGVFRMLFVG